MSKSLKKLIDINRLREFKNKLVGTGSAYVQTGAVDQTVGGTKTFPKPIVGSVTGSSGSCTGNAATATKAVSADSATNAGHATSADKATKAEQDGNGNNIVASYVAAGSDDSTTDDIGAFMAARPSFIKSFVYNDVWTDAISMRHRNGRSDGSDYGTYIRSSAMTGVSNLLWNHQFGGTWQGERTLIDSANLAGFVKSGITIYDLVPDGAEAHNSMWGGRDITAAFNAGTVSEHIADGTFKDIFPGDYITKQVTISGKTYDVTWVVADCDYWIHKGDTGMADHHVVIVPQAPIFSVDMNDTNTTEGGYMGSRMFKETIPACATGIVSAFGSDHILTFRDCATNNMNASATSPGLSGWWTGVAQGVAWADMRCNLMSEGMVYGNSIWSSSGDDNCIGLRQMSAFRLSEKAINYNRQWYWLRNVVASTFFAAVGDGDAVARAASHAHGVRPFALLK